MLIFLDSNIICADYKMKSPSFKVAQKVGTIVLGQIVVDGQIAQIQYAINFG